MAYDTLINKASRDDYDEYLASVGGNMDHEYDERDWEEIERRKRERGKKRFMDDYDFVNRDFFNMFKQRFQKFK